MPEKTEPKFNVRLSVSWGKMLTPVANEIELREIVGWCLDHGAPAHEIVILGGVEANVSQEGQKP